MKRRVHFVGIGGAGLSAIARVLHERGEIVSGSDRAMSPFARSLQEQGVQVFIGHRAENVRGAGLVVASSAVPEDNVELQAAHGLGIPVLRRSEFLPELTRGFRTIAIAGTHGKTTTTGLVAYLLERSGASPSFVVGGVLGNLGTNAKAGQSDLFVIEADEYDRAFLGLHPALAVVTNVEHDHPDCFPTLEDVMQAFRAFLAQVQEGVILCHDDPNARALRPGHVPVITYGLGPGAEWRAEDLRPNSAGGMDFLALKGGALLGLVRSRLPGEHNVRNVLAALAVSHRLGVPWKAAREAVSEYTGVGRRFQVLGQVRGVVVIDDYAHHPTEIKATLAAARSRYPQAGLWAVFQPHTFSRLRALMAAYTSAFEHADHVLVTDVYAAREAPDPEISGSSLAERILHPDVRYVAAFDEAVDILEREARPGDVVVTLSAGDANRIGSQLLERLQEGVQDG
jgi:UDP-N-acetylmuramate--alanine ligase